MPDINPTGGAGADDAIPLSGVRELCHDLLESAAAIGLLVRVAAAEADPAVAAGSQLSGQLELIATAASQVLTICTDVLDLCPPPAADVVRRQATTEPRVTGTKEASRVEDRDR